MDEINNILITMDTINKEDQMHLEELSRKKNTWHKCYVGSVCAIAAIVVIYCTVIIQGIDISDSVAQLLFGGVILGLALFAVMFFKYRMAYDAVLFKKKELGLPVKEEVKRRFFSTPHPSWSERVIKYLGCLLCLLAILLIFAVHSNVFTALPNGGPQVLNDHYSPFFGAMAMLGVVTMKYHPELSVLTRIFLWAAAILTIVGFPLFLMGFNLGGLLLLLSWSLSIINMFRIERELFYIEEEPA